MVEPITLHYITSHGEIIASTHDYFCVRFIYKAMLPPIKAAARAKYKQI